MSRQPDYALWFFGAVAGLLLLVSAPATYAVVAPFHSDGSTYGVALALFTLLALECGAVGSKLTTLVIPEWAGRLNVLTIFLLFLTTLANYASAADLFVVAKLPPTLDAVRAAGAGGLACVVYAALVPVLLFVFLTAFVARVKARYTSAHPGTAERITVVQPDRPALPQQDDETVIVAQRRLSWRQLADATGIPVTTLRRKIAGEAEGDEA